MSGIEEYKWPILTIVIIVVALMVMIAIGFTIGILSEDPDGLERAVIDARGEEWFEGLSSPWEPILAWIGNDYIIGVVGILLTLFLIIAVFEMVIYLKKKKQE
ncbi:MAG: hypothetical protein ACFFDN_44430 [Candidatus Hodarchaeota archaeon]